jgi:hypothetical protein
MCIYMCVRVLLFTIVFLALLYCCRRRLHSSKEGCRSGTSPVPSNIFYVNIALTERERKSSIYFRGSVLS